MTNKTSGKELVNRSGFLDRKIFIDEEIYKQELEQVFGRCWLFIGHESQVAKPNDFAAGYMAEDPILLCRDSKGKLHSFLNMCRHRGNRICRADSGNAPSFMCTYHGWTFATDGKLVGVPGYKEAYFEELDRSQWGLVEAAQLDTYKGLVFATWDSKTPPLLDYMGDMAWWLDLLVDRREGGTEVLGGVHKAILHANWKFGADNFSGDVYHFPITHASNFMTFGRRMPVFLGDKTRYTVNPGKGHGLMGAYVGPDVNPSHFINKSTVVRDYYMQTQPELEARLGTLKGRQGAISVATMFPNFTWHPSPMVRNWHPRGPDKMEIWSYCIVDKAAPPEVREAMRRNFVGSFGPSGPVEQDDMFNWLQCTSAAKTWMGKKYDMNITMGLGHETSHEGLPGVMSGWPSETNQRSFYTRWAEVMGASSWDKISLSPRTTP